MAATEDKHILQLSVAYANSSVLTLLQQQLKSREKKKSHQNNNSSTHYNVLPSHKMVFNVGTSRFVESTAAS